MDRLKTVRYIVAQLTLVRWCLDSIDGASCEAAHRNLFVAREGYENVRALIPQLCLEGEPGRQVQEEMLALRERLEVAGKQCRAPAPREQTATLAAA